jgi:beta-lactamase superfamily II metal-dependent hydrolase
MTVTFFHMGQGDAAVIRCPDGKVILVDCGSSKNFDPAANFRASVYLRHFAPALSLHALILTHPDKDHCNQVAAVLEGGKKTPFWPPGSAVTGDYDAKAMTVERIYFSDYEYRRVRADRNKGKPEQAAYDLFVNELNRAPLVRYKDGKASNTLYPLLGDPQQMSLVQLDGADDHVREWTGWDAREHASAERKINQAKERSLKGTPEGLVVASGKDWTVRIIAGNIARAREDMSDTLGSNASSLVTLVEMGPWKVLICGDATVSTENYLLAKRAKDVADLSVLQVPHHGSALTSSTDCFIKHTRPKMVVISVGLEEQTYHLPVLSPVDRWRAVTARPSGPHVVDGWKDARVEAQGQLASWIKKYQLDTRTIRYTLTAAQAEAARTEAGDNNLFAVSAQLDKGYVLYRRSVKESAFQTSLSGTEHFITCSPGG